MKKFTILVLALVLTFTFSLSVFAAEDVAEIEEQFNFFEWFKTTFTVERVVSFASALVSAFLTAIVANMRKSIDKTKEINTKQINSTIENSVKQIFENSIEKYQKPFVNKINELEAGIGKVVKGLALLQDGTPQAKLAMYDLVESTGIVDKSTIEICKVDVEKQIKVDEETKKEKITTLDKIIVPLE